MTLEWTAVRELAGTFIVFCAMPFFLAGTLGLLRFPDVFTRLHALTKADNVGLGLLVFGLVIKNWTIPAAAKLLLIWLLVMGASATICHLIAYAALQQLKPWSKK